MDARALGQYFENPDTLFQLVNNTAVCMVACNALNRTGVISRLLEGPADTAVLAASCQVPADRLARLLDYLTAHEIIEKAADGTYSANARTQVMHDARDYLVSTELGAKAGSKMHESLKGDGTPFEHFFGQPVFEYFSSNPDAAASFGGFMGWMTRRVQRFLFAEHRFEPFSTVVDIGGSMGDLLLAILEEYPGTNGILFDLPATAEIARAQVAESPLADRVEVVGGSFFEEVPTADLYTLKQILHDWNDEECRHILSTIRKAIVPGGRLAVIDHIVSDVPTPNEAQSTDIAMMIWDTGRERRLAEFEALFAASGYRLDRMTRNPAGHSVIEAVPV
ncbi:methyltransferase [Aurantiacibacter gilvus]|uniref:Methyltransferase n=1 Tax=Aurantiacibacter gilvus TaxID=3139141 RepID=A0ABU9IF24_9SPHN